MHDDATRVSIANPSWEMGRGTLSDLTKIAALAAVYFIAGKLGLKLAFLNQSASPVWPPTGIALAAVLLLGYRIWPGIWLGAFLVNITTAGSLLTTICIAGGNTLEAVAAAWLVQCFARGKHAFERANDILRFILLAAVVSTMISATVGVTSLALGGFAGWSNYLPIWRTWWLGDAVSAAIITPLIVIWSTTPSSRRDRQRILEGVLVLAMVVGIGLLSFGGPFAMPSSRYPQFLLYPPVLWAAYRFCQRGAISTVFAVSGVAIWETLHDFGPFASTNSNESLVLLQTYIGTLAVTNLVLGSVVSEREQAEEKVVQLNRGLRRRVEELQTIFRVLPVGVSIAEDPQCHRIIVNPALGELLGAPEGANVSLSATTGEHPASYKVLQHGRELKPHELPMQVAAMNGAEIHDREVEIVRADGQTANLLCNARPLLDEQGDVRGSVGAFLDITERKEAERRLTIALAITRTLAESPTLSDAMAGVLRTICEMFGWEVGDMWVADSDANVLRCRKLWHAPAVSVDKFVSESYERTFGPGVGLPGRVWASLTPVWIRDVTRDENFPRAVVAAEEGLHGAFAFPILSGAKPLAVMEFFSREIREPDDALLDMFGNIGSQIGQFMERKRAEEALSQNARLLDLSHDAIIVWAFDGTILYWNQGAEQLYGYLAKEARGRVTHQLLATVHPQDTGAFLAALTRDGEWTGELRHTAKDGRLLAIESRQQLVRDSDGRLLVLEINRDITGRKHAEQELRASQARFAGLIESAMDGIIAVDGAQRVVLFNPAAERMFGRTAGEALGKSIDQFIPPRFREAHRKHIEKFGTKGTTNRRMGALGALSGIRANGDEFPIEASISHMEVGGRKLFTVILRDITERKETEAQLEAWQRELESRVEQRTIELALAHKQLQAQIDERKRLEAEIARVVEREQLRLGQELHDGLGQQLAGIGYMMTAMQTKLRKASAPSARDAQKLEKLLQQSVEQVRNLAKGFYPIELEKRGLLSALEEVAGSIEQSFAVRCVLQSDGSSYEEQKGPLAIQLFRIAQEAIHNAIKHARAKQITILLATVNGNITLTVRDDGIGLPLNLNQATGMGLRIMQHRARMIGGAVDFHNSPGGGAIVTCSVPCGEWPASSHSPNAMHQQPAVDVPPTIGRSIR